MSDKDNTTWLDLLRQWVPPLVVLPFLFHGVGMLRGPSLPDTAPEFVLSDLTGESVSLSSFRGKTVVLNFWATWCGPCRIEAPSFSSFADNNPDIVVLGIAADGSVGQLKAAQKQLGIRYDILQGTPEVLKAYDVGIFPTTVVVDPEGAVQSVYGGLMTRPQLWWATR